MVTGRSRRSDARQRCIECGEIVDPSTCCLHESSAEAGDVRARLREALLVGIYCGSDCLLDAWKRGWARQRRQG